MSATSAIVVSEAKNANAIERCLAIRIEVFVDEQKVPRDEEIDDLDDECEHFLAYENEGQATELALGTARLQIKATLGKAQRVAVLKRARGLGVGRALMHALEDRARARGCHEMQLGAQVSAIPFYETIGYIAFGELYDDAGIDHRMMKKALG